MSTKAKGNKKEEITIVLDEAKVVKNEVKPEVNEVEAMTSELEDKLKVTGITINQEAPKVTPKKMVKIKANKRHQCFIGGTWYYLEQGKQYNVPEEVKTRLMSAGVLAPL